jgi:hypothetical protein
MNQKFTIHKSSQFLGAIEKKKTKQYIYGRVNSHQQTAKKKKKKKKKKIKI